MGASIYFINSKGRDNTPTHNSNSQLHRTYIHPPLHYLLTTNCPARAHLFLLARPLPCSKPNQIYIPPTILPLTYFIHLPMKVEPIVSSQTSAIKSQMPGNYPKRNKLQYNIQYATLFQYLHNVKVFPEAQFKQ